MTHGRDAKECRSPMAQAQRRSDISRESIASSEQQVATSDKSGNCHPTIEHVIRYITSVLNDVQRYDFGPIIRWNFVIL